MIDADDVQLQIKKKARRRLVGAAALFAFAALALPLVMDQEPAPATQEIDIRIPGQNGEPFLPNIAPPPEPAPAPAASVPPAPAPEPKNVARIIDRTPSGEAPTAPEPKPAIKPEAKPEAKPAVSFPPAVPAARPVEVKPALDSAEARRAAAILAGRAPDVASASTATPTPTPPGGAANTQHVILIGAFSNEANVQNLKTKLGELGVRVYTEPLESPQGAKTRVRAGPFPSRAAAEGALEKMKRIGVSGVVAAQ
ncbi:MAG: SPOR domain-containing protein [Zoogloeaceae bacterium]|nr:SPOR domain-containing protein [Zoogloeaceae bacterium]